MVQPSSPELEGGEIDLRTCGEEGGMEGEGGGWGEEEGGKGERGRGDGVCHSISSGRLSPSFRRVINLAERTRDLASRYSRYLQYSTPYGVLHMISLEYR